MDKLHKKLNQFLSSVDHNDWPSIELDSQQSDADNKLVLQLTINPELSYLKGHFPGKSVVPGVVQVHWASLLASHFFTGDKVFLKMENVKFQSMLLPNQAVTLSLVNKPEKRQVVFTYRCESGVASEGKLYFRE